MLIIGITGKARAGKDTIGNLLWKDHAFERFAFADNLKSACVEIFGLSPEQVWCDEKEEPDTYWNTTPRNLLQYFGTEVMREGFGKDIWIKSLGRSLDNDLPSKAVITDVRFDNEAEFVRGRGGIIINVTRTNGPSIATANHASEAGISPHLVDYTVTNDGTIDELRKAIYELPKIKTALS